MPHEILGELCVISVQVFAGVYHTHKLHSHECAAAAHGIITE